MVTIWADALVCFGFNEEQKLTFALESVAEQQN
jgi:hypothetical protein